MSRLPLFSFALVLIVAGCSSPITPIPEPTPTHEVVAAPTPTPTPTPTPLFVPTVDRTEFSIDDPESPWVIINKLRRISPKNFRPANLVTLDVPHVYQPIMRADAGEAYVELFEAAKAEGIDIAIQNAFRAYDTQDYWYNQLVSSRGRKAADLTSARPGHSEHQTGLAVDISAANRVCAVQACFAKTPEGKWLAENAWKYGWHLRYPKGKTDITGYNYEPWHFRFVGKELAADLNQTRKLTMEEFFELPAAPDYAR